VGGIVYLDSVRKGGARGVNSQKLGISLGQKKKGWTKRGDSARKHEKKHGRREIGLWARGEKKWSGLRPGAGKESVLRST